MATIAELEVKITSEFAKINSDLAGLRTKLDAADSKTKTASASMSKAFKIIGTAIAAIGIGRLTKEIISLASEAEETRNKFNVVFSDIRDAADAAATNLNQNFGLSRQAAEDLLSGTGDLLTGFGLTQEKALELSDAAAQLGTDLASFTNYAGGAKGATEALAAAMLGERERVKMLGIAITETDLKQFAAEQGKNWELMDRGAKATLTLEMAMKQSKNAIGDFARSSGSYANQMRIAEANTKDLLTSLGSAFLPLATLAVRAFNEISGSLKNVAEDINKFVSSAEGADKISDIIGGIVGTFSALKTLITPIVTALKDGFEDIITPIEKATEGTKDFSGGILVLSGVITGLSSVLRLIAISIRGIIQSFIDIGKVIFDVSGVITEFFKALKTRNFDEVRTSFDDLIKDTKQFGVNIAETAIDAKDVLINSFKTFTEEAKRLNLEVNNNYTQTFDDIKNKTELALQAAVLAEQNAAKKKTDAAKKGANDKSNYEVQKASETAQKVLNVVNGLVGQLSAIYTQYYTNKGIELDNQFYAEQEKLDEDYENKKKRIENNILDEEERTKALEALDEEYSTNSGDLAKELDKQKRKLAREAAEKTKAIAIIQSIINTALGVTQALASIPPPYSFVVAAITGALGAVQTGLIASQPLPAAAEGMFGNTPFIAGEAGREIAVPLDSDQGRGAIRELAAGMLDMMGQMVDTRGTMTEKQATGTSGGGGNVYLDGTLIGRWLSKGSNNGAFTINKRVLVS